MTTTTTADNTTNRPPLRLSLLSQSELYSLSQSSNSSFNLNHSDDVVIPKINRAVFNESAGGRKQTYSRFRLASTKSSSTTLHRRTPHLRLSHTTTTNNINDPEQAENSQIIRMLKQFCKSDPNFKDLGQIEDENNSNLNSVVDEVLNSETLGIKRKRGRPRKHENVVFIRPPNAKRLRNNTVKKVVVYDDERDREIVNDRGVMVNMVTLAGLEDPYGPEIRRRSVGMSTEDELLGFLRGLNGQWGSRRRKRRVVDASEFGDFLPKGWKLSLCIKKKEGRVWLFVRRYLSPSGRQFESCKEISSYLISIIGEENLEKRNHVNINNSDDFALKGASVNPADLVLPEDTKRDGPVDNPPPSSPPSSSPSSPPVPPLPTNCEEQITLVAMETADHVPSPPPPPPPSLPPVPPVPTNCEGQGTLDAMEVQVEDHSGSDVKNEIEKSQPSLELDCEIEKTETYDAHSGDKLEPASPCVNYKNNSDNEDEQTDVDKINFIEESCENSGKNRFMNDEVSKTDLAPDAAVSQFELFGDESNRNPETYGDINVNCDDNKSGCNLDDQGVNSRSFLLSPFPNEQMDNDSGVGKDKISVCSTDQVVNKDHVSETSGELHVDIKSSCNLDDQGINSRTFQISPFPNEQMSDDNDRRKDEISVSKDIFGTETGLFKKANICEEKGFAESSSSGLFLGRFGLDKDCATVVKKLSTKSTRNDSVKSVNNTETLISFQKQDSPSPHQGLESSRIDEQLDVSDYTTKNNLEFCSLVPSENEPEFGFQDDERGLLNHFSDDIFENKIYSTPLDGLKFDEDRDINSNELSLAFGNHNSKINEAFDVHTSLTMVNSSMVNLSGNVKTSGFQNGGDNTGYPGYGSNHGQSQTCEEVVPSGMWRTGDGSQLGNGLSNPSHAQISFPSSFHSFNIMSEKTGDQQFRLDERYNEGFGVSGLRSGNRPEPVEFSFLTGRSQHNPIPLQPDSRVFSYNSEMEPQFDSNFWVGKNTMMPNTSGRNQITGVCAWCRNEFHMQPVHSGTQDGIGSLCPSCSAGMSGHVNML